MDNRFPPSDDRPTGPDLRKDSAHNEQDQNHAGDPYRSDPEGSSYEERVNPPFSPYDEFPRDDRQMGRLKHSGLGIASFVLSLISIALYIVCFVAIIGIFASIANSPEQILNNFDSMEPGGEVLAIGLAGLGLLGSALLNFIGLILGIVGLVMKDRKKVFAIIGTVLNGLCLLIGGGIIVISTITGAGM
ncbi:DUF4064 domain-containing protein [Saccharibacillus kuerlensis]|uniref:DUF4064 domain-containing protein n=1 Tax=Saccharibacillus kuerlensis TaxID=459527 RepID=A0ABQ2KSP8_9BACL|nr:DUF4064 domain-containing protein [Saccharibacillus kuerlensis]GGN92143.1 hypothetical protein GCM10010969_04300 [Saccharibacillus kuerlensis]